MQTCEIVDCEGVAFVGDRCVGHLSASDFERLLSQRGPYDGDLDARRATIDGDRVTSLVAKIAGGRAALDFTDARIWGDVVLSGERLTVRGGATVVDIALRLLAALFFALFVVAIRNRVRR